MYAVFNCMPARCVHDFINSSADWLAASHAVNPIARLDDFWELHPDDITNEGIGRDIRFLGHGWLRPRWLSPLSGSGSYGSDGLFAFVESSSGEEIWWGHRLYANQTKFSWTQGVNDIYLSLGVSQRASVDAKRKEETTWWSAIMLSQTPHVVVLIVIVFLKCWSQEKLPRNRQLLSSAVVMFSPANNNIKLSNCKMDIEHPCQDIKVGIKSLGICDFWSCPSCPQLCCPILDEVF